MKVWIKKNYRAVIVGFLTFVAVIAVVFGYMNMTKVDVPYELPYEYSAPLSENVIELDDYLVEYKYDVMSGCEVTHKESGRKKPLINNPVDRGWLEIYYRDIPVSNIQADGNTLYYLCSDGYVKHNLENDKVEIIYKTTNLAETIKVFDVVIYNKINSKDSVNNTVRCCYFTQGKIVVATDGWIGLYNGSITKRILEIESGTYVYKCQDGVLTLQVEVGEDEENHRLVRYDVFDINTGSYTEGEVQRFQY